MTRYIVDTIQLLTVQEGTVDAGADTDALCDAASGTID